MVVKYLVVPDDFSMFAYNGKLNEGIICDSRADAEELVMELCMEEVWLCYCDWDDGDFWKSYRFIEDSCYKYWSILEVCFYGD